MIFFLVETDQESKYQLFSDLIRLRVNNREFIFFCRIAIIF